MNEPVYYIVILHDEQKKQRKYLYVSKSGYGYGDTLDISSATRFGTKNQARYWIDVVRKNPIYRFPNHYVYEIVEVNHD